MGMERLLSYLYSSTLQWISLRIRGPETVLGKGEENKIPDADARPIAC
jgi:hypothetical protein